MADIVVRNGEVEATVSAPDGETFTYNCSEGAWCGLPIMESTNQLDVIMDAVVHVDRHAGVRE